MLHAAATEVLRSLAGPDAVLRADQWEAIEALVVERRRALVVQRTGWGKSAVYFVATALLRREGGGPTVIISPLLALMRNQIAAAERAGIHAVTINSSNVEEWDATYARVVDGEVDVLLVSPERLNNPTFRDQVLGRLTQSCGLLVVDEAHCISDWGHDFRPDYRRIRTLLPELPSGTPVLATTATANSRVVDDVSDVLGLGLDAAGVLVQRGSLDRESLHLGVLELPNHAHRLAWLSEHLGRWPGSGIIYVLTVSTAEEVAEHLRGAGHEVLAYTGQTDETERLQAERALLNNEVKALVATSALGMGYDKPDLEFVVHLGAPASPIAYYQQVGRAGRATPRADVVLLPGDDDEAIWRYFDSMAFPPERSVREVLNAMALADRPVRTPELEVWVDLSRSRLESMLKVLDVDGVVRRTRDGWSATGEPWEYDAERYGRVAAAKHREQQAMRDYIRTAGCRMEFLRTQLDDAGAAPCGRCDNCTGTKVHSGTTEDAVRSARMSLDRPGVVIEPKKLWPSNMPALGIDVRGKIDPDESAERGRALGRLSGIGLGPKLRAILADGAPDGPVDADLLDHAIKVLSVWKADWPERPSAIVSVGSHRRPAVIASLAEGIAAAGRLPYLGVLEHTGPSAGGGSNSAHRLRSVWDAYRAPSELEHGIQQLAGKPVFLVDDLADTGWTLAVAARLLRNLQAGPVYPLVLGVAR